MAGRLQFHEDAWQVGVGCGGGFSGVGNVLCLELHGDDTEVHFFTIW